MPASKGSQNVKNLLPVAFISVYFAYLPLIPFVITAIIGFFLFRKDL